MMEAVIGLFGVIVGALIAVSKDVIGAFWQRRRNGSYAAIRIVSVLDQFVQVCVDIVFDDGTKDGQYVGVTTGGEGYPIPQVSLPDELLFPNDFDWKSIGNELMYRTLVLPNKIKQANTYINHSIEYGPFDEYFEARHKCYANLGLEALELAALLREKFGIPELSLQVKNNGWDTKKILLKRKAEIETLEMARNAQ